MYLGIDLGTSSLKACLADRTGKLIDTARAEYASFYPRQGWSEQNPEDWYRAAVACIRELGAKYDLSKVRAVGFCGQMHGLVLLDGRGRVLRPAILWNDNRATEECEYLNQTVGKESLLAWTGNIAYAGFTAPKVLWLQKNEKELFRRIDKILLPKDYLVYRMSGVFASDVSDCSGTLYYDVAHKRWSAEMLELLRLSPSQLPRVYESSEVVGTVSEDFAKETGLSTTALVVAGGGDQAVGAIGAGAIGNDALHIGLGTSGVLFACTDGFRLTDGGLHSFCRADGGYHLMGCMLSCAAAVDFWLENLLQTTDFAADMANIANASADELYFLPYLAGERSPINDASAKGLLYGLTISHTRADVTRAVVEGVCLGLKDCYEAMRRSGVDARFATAVGGGTKSSVWLQILADCLQMEIRTVSIRESGGMGAVILAMVGDGVYADIPTACKALISYGKSIKPNAESADVYEQKYARFKDLYKRMR